MKVSFGKLFKLPNELYCLVSYLYAIFEIFTYLILERLHYETYSLSHSISTKKVRINVKQFKSGVNFPLY